MTDNDKLRKKKARARRLKQKQKRLRDWQGDRLADWTVFKRLHELEKGLAALKEMLGTPTNAPQMVWLSRPCKVVLSPSPSGMSTDLVRTLVPTTKRGITYTNVGKPAVRNDRRIRKKQQKIRKSVYGKKHNHKRAA